MIALLPLRLTNVQPLPQCHFALANAAARRYHPLPRFIASGLHTSRELIGRLERGKTIRCHQKVWLVRMDCGIRQNTVTVAEEIADWTLRFETAVLSSRIIELAKLSVLDAMGCAYASYCQASVLSTLDVISDLGGTGECTVIGRPERTSVVNATLANGTLIRALDLNDHMAIDPSDGMKLGGHPSDSVAPAIAVSERHDLPGVETLTALVMGYELFGRMQRLLRRERPWDHTTALGVVSSAVAGRLMGLDREALAHAIALGAAHCATPGVVRRGRLSAAKFLAGPIVAHHGVLAAMLASRGVTGPLEVFEGERGLGSGVLPEEDLSKLTLPIRDPFMLEGVTIKAYPCMDTSQAAVAAALEVRNSLRVPHEGIDRLELFMMDHPTVQDQVRDPDRRHPGSRETADHSFYFLVAVSFLDGELTPRQFENDRWLDPQVCDFMDKITIGVDKSWNERAGDGFPCSARALVGSAVVAQARVAYAPGHPRNRMVPQGVIEKFTACTKDALDDHRRAKIIETTLSLDRTISVRELTQLLRFN